MPFTAVVTQDTVASTCCHIILSLMQFMKDLPNILFSTVVKIIKYQ
jgi:hypothetical protein